MGFSRATTHQVDQRDTNLDYSLTSAIMKTLLSRTWLSALLVALLALTSPVKADDDRNTVKEFLGQLRAKYDALPETGKFATGAFIGFSGSRIVVNSAVGVVKIAGAAFIATEVLNAAGVLDDIPSFSDEQIQLAESMKRRALTIASDFRQTVRKRVNPEQLRGLMETDKKATMGAAAGAFVGFML